MVNAVHVFDDDHSLSLSKALRGQAGNSLRFNASTLVGLYDGVPDYGLTGVVIWRF
jgi:hypothetical protein